ncbi:MAG TPA: zinc-finger domain-containing protein [Burkholderiales bacterium]|nr:zinc-finger domain-containing protein [Burkholderiales bacterium]
MSTDTARRVDVTEKDLPLHCPLPGAPLWSRHPRVFLDVVKQGQALCPYCGTQFVYKGAAPKGH